MVFGIRLRMPFSNGNDLSVAMKYQRHYSNSKNVKYKK